MKERPILFSAPMVRALLAGTKTQTRRIVKPQPSSERVTFGCIGGQGFGFIFGDSNTVVNCPYGQTGDLLWVRETWAHVPEAEEDGTYDGQRMGFIYRADGEEAFSKLPEEWEFLGPWKPSIFCPRQASRMTLRIANVRVERLNEISEADALAEGIYSFPSHQMTYFHWLKTAATETHFLQPEMAYRDLWNSINGPYAWDINPWVWVVEFKRVEVAA